MADDQSELSYPASVTPPSCSFIEKALPDLFELYKKRNDWIWKMRAHTNGTNDIEVPTNTTISIKTVHMMNLQAARNERKSGFLQVPRYRITPPGESATARAYASELELAFNTLLSITRRTNDDYGRMLNDILAFDGGCLRWEMNAEAAWPRLIPGGNSEIDGKPGPDEIQHEAMEKGEDPDAKREKYKQEQGLESLRKLFTHAYVPYEAFYPFPYSGSMEECIELEFRPVKQIVDNQLFAPEAREMLRAQAAASGEYISFRDMAPIIRYCNREVYAYYLIPTILKPAPDEVLIKKFTTDTRHLTNVQELYFYEHNAGLPLYTDFAGADGGWTDGDNGYLEGRLRAIAEVSQTQDELGSQAYTSLRTGMWPTFVVKRSQERPSQPLNDNDPRQITTDATRNIQIYNDEDIAPVPMPREHPLYESFRMQLAETMAKLTGAASLYGMHQPGVDGGFQEATLLQQAESIFARMEANIVTGSVNDAIVLFSLIRAQGEKVWVRVPQKNTVGKAYYKNLAIDPGKLYPMPQIDAIVRAQSEQDKATALKNYAAAVTPIAGPGTAAFDPETARETYLNVEQPDIMGQRVITSEIALQVAIPIIQEEATRIYFTGTVEEQAAEAEAAQVDPMAMMMGDPLMAGEMAPFANGEAAPGALPPPPNMANPAGTQGMNGGLPTGMGQPDQTMGRIDGIMEQGGLM